MSRTLVIYDSKYGHTKRYAQWLAEELSADICEIKTMSANRLQEYSTIIFGSSLYAGRNRAALLLAKHFEQIKDKRLALFTCGITDTGSESSIAARNRALDAVITPEIREKTGIFHVRGGIDYERLSFIHRMMMKFVYSITSKKPENELTDEERDFLAIHRQKIDFSDKKMLKPVIRYCLEA